MKKFVFLYPIPEYIDNLVKNGGFGEAGGINRFRKKYRKTLNSCINLRYRNRGFEVNYATFSSHPVSRVIEVLPKDRIIDVGMEFKTHTSKKPNGDYPYPDPDYILRQVGDSTEMVISGFHMWDCVERLAKRAHKKGVNTLVDEDLTEFLPSRINDPDFKEEVYPTFNPRKINWLFEEFMEARKGKPWLWQKY